MNQLKEFFEKYPSLARGVRSVVALVISSLIAYFTNHPALLWLAPVITSLAKALRDKFGWDWIPV